MTGLARHTQWGSSGMAFVGIANFLDLRSIPQDETYPWQHYLNQDPVTRQVEGLRGESTTIILAKWASIYCYL